MDKNCEFREVKDANRATPGRLKTETQPTVQDSPVLSEKQEVLPAEAKCTLCLTNPLMGAFRYEHPVFLLRNLIDRLGPLFLCVSLFLGPHS